MRTFVADAVTGRSKSSDKVFDKVCVICIMRTFAADAATKQRQDETKF